MPAVPVGHRGDARPPSATDRVTSHGDCRSRWRGRGSPPSRRASVSSAAVAAPMPLAPPVTTATRPSNLPCRASLTSRIDVDLRGRAPCRVALAGQHRQPRRPGRPSRPRADAGRPRRTRTRAMVPARPPDALRMPTAVTSLSAIRRVSTRLGSPARPMKTTRPPGSTRSTARAGSVGRVRGVDHRVERQRRQRRPRSRRSRSPATGRSPAAQAEQVHLGARPRGRTWATSRPIVPGPSDQHPVAGRRGPAACDRAQRVAAGLDQRAQRGVDRVRQGVQGARPGPASCSASAPGQPPRMPISYRSAHTCCRPDVQRSQCPQPSIVSPVTRRPIQAGSTPAPTAATVPHHSWPIRIG